MTRHSRLLISLGILAIGAIGVAVAQEVRELPAREGGSDLIAGGSSGAARDGATPQLGPRSRYKTLITTIQVPADQATYGDFCDYGYWQGGSYGGHEGLPPGYWVYVAPTWYIYKDACDAVAATPKTPRAWGPEQATGAPDTWPNSGDIQTAWASQTPDGQKEWLELTYEAPIRPTAVLIYETYNPGAVDRVTGFNADGKEFDLWAGADPTPAGSGKGISIMPLHPEIDVTKIRVYLDSPKVAGWNEIDAVGLLDASGVTHWAKSATASSTYADYASQPGNLELEDRSSGGEIKLRSFEETDRLQSK
jgi:hypothetical protein